MKELKVFIYSIIAGIAIGLGGCAFLSVDNKVVGAAFFVIGLFTICTFGFNLYTGKVCYVWENDAMYGINTVLIWAGNLVGCWLTAQLYGLTRISPAIMEKAAAMVETKFNDSPLSIFILAVFCNLCIYIAVDGFKNNPHELGKYLALFFGVMVFIICGFEHVVANMFYISVAKGWCGYAWLFMLVNTAGNCVGGWIVPLAKKLVAHCE